MRVESDLDESVVLEAIARAWRDVFARYDSPGQVAIRELLLDALCQQDVRDMVEAEARRLLPVAVRDVVGELLRAEARKQAKALQRAGALFDPAPGGE